MIISDEHWLAGRGQAKQGSKQSHRGLITATMTQRTTLTKRQTLTSHAGGGGVLW
jgi:hypothetical protein